VRAGFTQTDYDAETRSDWTSQQYRLFANATLTPQTIGSASVGYGISTPTVTDGATDESTTTMVGGLQLRTELARDLSHAVGWSRDMAESFNSAYDVSDSFTYQVDWKHDALTTRFDAGLRKSQPSREDVPAYSDWRAAVQFSYPLTAFARLHLGSTYDRRDNDELSAGTTDADPEWAADYSTWSSRIGTGFQVVENVAFDTGFEHIERFSSSEDLEYSRDVFSANLTYTHGF
jgi:hypothetical protein